MLRKLFQNTTGGSLALLFAVLTASLMVTFELWKQQKMLTHPVLHMKNLIVSQRWEPYRYEFISEQGIKFTQTISRENYPVEPEFSAGLMLDDLWYMDLDDVGEGSWLLNPEMGCGYRKHRDKYGRPVFVKLPGVIAKEIIVEIYAAVLAFS
jgi:hypothetical protein